MDGRAIVIFNMERRGKTVDLDIPLNISAMELIAALNRAYNLEMDVSDVSRCHLKAEAPIALLKGSKMLSEFGIRNGTRIIFDE